MKREKNCLRCPAVIKFDKNLFDLEGKMNRRVMLQGKAFVAEAQKLEGVPYFCHSIRIALN